MASSHLHADVTRPTPLPRPCTVSWMSNLQSINHRLSKLQASLASLEPSPLPASSFLLIQFSSLLSRTPGPANVGPIVPAPRASPDRQLPCVNPAFFLTQPLHRVPTARKARSHRRRRFRGSASTSDPHPHIDATWAQQKGRPSPWPCLNPAHSSTRPSANRPGHSFGISQQETTYDGQASLVW